MEAGAYSWLPPTVSSALVEIVSDGVLVTDTDGTILQANDAFAGLCQREAWELEGASVALIAGDSEDPVAEIAALLAGATEWTGRVEIRRRDGRLVECDAWVRTFEGDAGSCWISVQRRVGVRRRYGAAVIEEFEATIHELVNSLASLRGFIELLDHVSDDQADDVRRRLSGVAGKASDRLDSLLRQLGGPPGSI